MRIFAFPALARLVRFVKKQCGSRDATTEPCVRKRLLLVDWIRTHAIKTIHSAAWAVGFGHIFSAKTPLKL